MSDHSYKKKDKKATEVTSTDVDKEPTRTRLVVALITALLLGAGVYFLLNLYTDSQRTEEDVVGLKVLFDVIPIVSSVMFFIFTFRLIAGSIKEEEEDKEDEEK